MRLIKYNDSCVIKRSVGKDQYDNIVISEVYKGDCLYQERSVVTTQGTIIRRATLYIQGRTNAGTNDLVDIMVSNDTKVSAIVGDIDIITLSITGAIISRLELKQGIE